MIKRISITLAVMIGLVVVHRATAQVGFNSMNEPCAPITDMLNAAEKSGEKVVFQGKTKDNYKFIVTSDGKGAWTLLMANNRPDAGGLVPQACIKASNLDQISGEQS